MKNIRKILILIGIGVSVYIIGVLFYVFTPALNDFTNRTEFDSQAWIAWEETESTLQLRWNMVNDLTKNYELNGKSVFEIKTMLGEPSFESNDEIYYGLGMTGFGINTGSLVLKTKNNIIIGYQVIQG